MKSYNKFCFSTIVFGDYARYIPLYIYSALKAYPSASIVIFLEKLPDSTIMEAVDLLRKEKSGDIIIDVDFLPSVQHLQNIKINGGGKKIARWLIPEDFFRDYEYVLISDVDIFFLKEDPDLITFHVDRMKHISLPFSNSIRPKSKRITGIHFFSREQYYNKLGKIIDRIVEDEDCLMELISDLPNNSDENFLYNLLSKAMDISILESQPYNRPWHGLHLGTGRNLCGFGRKFKNNSSVAEDDVRRQLISLLEDDIFIILINLLKTGEILFYLGYCHIRLKDNLLLPEKFKLRHFLDNIIPGSQSDYIFIKNLRLNR